MSDLSTYLTLTDRQQRHLEQLDAGYRQMYEDPEGCRPMFIINTPVELPTWEERLADPLVMLAAELDQIRPHLALADDRVATVRVQFGTAQVAAAFGCAVFVPPNNLPAAGSHVLAHADDVYALSKPDINAGWYGKLWDWQRLWLPLLPAGVHMQHPDIQSPFNSAHLIRGNDIFTDFYDNPAALERLLDLVTDFMIDVMQHANAMIGRPEGWFYDWGALWKGAARISNCSNHMIRPQFYTRHILERDVRFFEALGGGRMHYCGSPDPVIDAFFRVPLITGLDYDEQYHSLWSLADRAPRQVTLLQSAGEATLRRLLSGDWPAKRNIIITASAATLEEGLALLAALRKSVP